MFEMATEDNYSENSCRTCMKEDSLMFDLFIEQIGSSNIADMLNSCAKLNILKEDSLPKQICRYCYTCITSFSNFCNTAQKTQEKLIQIMLENEENNHNVNLCDFDEIKIEYNDIHVNTCESSQLLDVKVECDICLLTFKNKDSLAAHMEDHTEKGFPNESNLKDHLNKHRGVKPYACPVCSKKFSRLSSVGKHIKIHTCDEVHLCPTCGEKCDSSTDLKQHMLRHNGLNQFACTMCPKKFVSKDALISHTVTHTGEYPYACDQCGVTFAVRSALNHHQQSGTCTKSSVPRSAAAPTPGPSGEQSRSKSLADGLKVKRAAKVKEAKNLEELNSNQRNQCAEIKEAGCYMLPNSPKRKGKGKGKRSASRSWVPSSLLPDSPAVPPPRKRQTREGGPHETTEVNSDNDSDVIESTPSIAPLQPPSIAVPSTDSTGNPVWTDLQVIGFAPKSNISPPASVSGISAVSYEIDVDVKPYNPSSDDEDENNIVDVPIPSNFQYQLDDLDGGVGTLAEDLKMIDTEADIALRALADLDDDLLDFDWREDIRNFQGVREEFTGSSGPTFAVTELSPLEVFKKIWDDDIIDLIVRETNRYARQMQVTAKEHSRMSRWKDTTREEIWRFFTIIMLQSMSVTNVEREYWYPVNEQSRIGAHEKIMSYNRFILLKKCLHFVNNTSLPLKPSKLDKIMPVIRYLNEKFSKLYLPQQNVSIDESLLLWKGRLSFSQQIASKRAKVGIKSYELCEANTGYLWRMKVYSGKDDVRGPQEQYGQGEKTESAIFQIIYNLMRPLFGKGHTVVMDKFYNAPLLSRILKRNHKTDTMGTLRLNREFVPETLKQKTKTNMNVGEVCFSTTKDLSVVVCKDKNVVSLISTFHCPEVEGIEEYGYYKYIPKVVLDYNLYMGGVDLKDQMLHAYPIERVRNSCWYKKLFRRLLNVSIINAMVIFNHGRSQKTHLENKAFRVQLVQELMQMYSPQALKQRQSPPCAAIPQEHLPSKNRKSRPCKFCHKAKVRRSTVWKCNACNVHLCMETCFDAYHAKYVNQ